MGPGDQPPSLRDAPWARILLWALAGTIIVSAAVLLDVRRTGYNVLNVIRPGLSGPSAEQIQEDFPEVELPRGIGHDGQQFYVVARHPLDFDEAAPHLDRPRYRLQRPLFPWFAALLHPGGGGGPGLVWAMLLIGVASLLVGGATTGLIAHRLRGDTRLGILFPLLPGSYVSLRIGTGDHLALALLAVTLALLLHHRPWLATGAATLMVLAKEPMAAPLVGLLLWRRDKEMITVVGVPLVVAGTWFAYLRATVESERQQVLELTYPLGGLIESITRHWSEGEHLYGAAAFAATIVVAGFALSRRGFRDPIGGPLLGQLALMAVLFEGAVAGDYNGTRIVMPAMLLGILGLIRPGLARAPEASGVDHPHTPAEVDPHRR